MGSFIMSLELINGKIGVSFPRHQQYQQLGSKRAQRLAVDQLDLFARFHISNLEKTRIQTYPNSGETTWVTPSSANFIFANEIHRGKISNSYS